MTENANVDPRFDPIFQRGYNGGAGERPVVREQAPEVRPVAAEPAETEPDAPRAPAATAGRAVITAEVVGGDPAPARRSLVPNPFIVILWLIGVGLTAGGVWLALRFFAEQYSGPMNEEMMVLQQLTWALTPAGVTVGLAIIAGLLFWHAAGWQRSRR